MNRHFSSYLDLVRFVAAVLVVLDHLVTDHVVSSALANWLPTMGREAVATFFVLSGFVIAYVTASKPQTLARYAGARAARIYAVALPLLLLAFLGAFLLRQYGAAGSPLDYQLDKFYLYMPFHSLFLGELWRHSETPVWLNPYWSLSYEVWYYIFFGVLFFLRGRTRLLLAAAIFAVLGYKLWLLLPVWWAGVVLWQLRDRLRPGVGLARAGWLLSIGLFVAYKCLHGDDYLRSCGNALWPFAQFPLGSADRYLADYLVALLVVLNFHCAQHAQLAFPAGAARLIRLLAAYTFPLYLTHALVMSAWQSTHASAATGIELALLVLAMVVATWLVGMTTEPFRRWLEVFFTRLASLFGSTVVDGARVAGGRK